MGLTFRPVLVSTFVVAISAVLHGQTASHQQPVAFEVASIKPTDVNEGSFRFRVEPDGTTVASGITLRRLLMTAYNVQGFRIVGGPSWVDSQRWDIQAKHTGYATVAQIRQMLVALVTDRFRLRAQLATRTLPVYDLVVEAGGPRVPVTKDIDAKPTVRVEPGSLQITNAPLGTFASQLSYAVGRPVNDRTRLSGHYDFRLEWTPVAGEDGGPTTAGLPAGADERRPSSTEDASIFTAIREQLGLRLRAARAPVDVVVIDHAERPSPD